MNFKDLREEVCVVNRSLRDSGLVVVHSGNASGFHRESGCVLIKPSGVDIDQLRPGMLVATDMEGVVLPPHRVPDGITSDLRPSVDLIHHLGIYREYGDVAGIVHTHSTYATAWAAVEKSVPCVITACADEFGGPIPCAPYVDNVGSAIVDSIIRHRTRAPAILLGKHGVFAFGKTTTAAFKTAAMTEWVAKTTLLAMQLGDPLAIPAEEITKWWTRYHTTYGQSSKTERP